MTTNVEMVVPVLRLSMYIAMLHQVNVSILMITAVMIAGLILIVVLEYVHLTLSAIARLMVGVFTELQITHAMSAKRMMIVVLVLLMISIIVVSPLVLNVKET